jgi:hypothetical protein
LAGGDRVGDDGFEAALGQGQPQRQADHAATTDQDVDAPHGNSCLNTMQKTDFAHFSGKMTCLFLSHSPAIFREKYL